MAYTSETQVDKTTIDHSKLHSVDQAGGTLFADAYSANPKLSKTNDSCPPWGGEAANITNSGAAIAGQLEAGNLVGASEMLMRNRMDDSNNFNWVVDTRFVTAINDANAQLIADGFPALDITSTHDDGNEVVVYQGSEIFNESTAPSDVVATVAERGRRQAAGDPNYMNVTEVDTAFGIPRPSSTITDGYHVASVIRPDNDC